MIAFWVLGVVALIGVAGWKAWQDQPRQAVAWVVVLSLLVPVWIAQPIFGKEINVRIAGVIAALVVYLFHRNATFRTRLVAIDFAVIALLAAHLLSDWWNSGVSIRPVLMAYGEWGLAYLAGRVAIQCLQDVRDLTPVVVVVICLLSAAAVAEAMLRVNVFEMLVGQRPLDQSPRDLVRWGIKRAYGPAMHSIFFGMLQLLLFPWALYAAARAKRHRAPIWWQIMPGVSVAGVVATASRAPVLAIVVALYVLALLCYERWRQGLLIGGTVTVLLGVTFHQEAFDLLDRWDRWGAKERRPELVVVDGERKEYNSTLSRVRTLEVYRPAMARAGVLGFGSAATTGFPINVPVGPQHARTLKRVRFIDNTYLLLFLRFGYLGLFSFVALGVSVVSTFAWLSLRPGTRGRLFLAGSAATIAGFLLLVATVWNSHDFGFWYMWSAGVAAGLLAHHRPSGDEPRMPRSTRATRDQTRGHGPRQFARSPGSHRLRV